MIKSIVSNKTRPIASAALRCNSAEKVLQQQQRRLFAHGHIVVGGVGGGGTCSTSATNASNNKNSVEYDDEENDKSRFLNAMGENDSLRFSTVYSLAMSSLEGSRFPPLSRNLNEREREQLRISRTQKRMMGSTRKLAYGGDTLTNESPSSTELLDGDEISCSMAYSLSFASSINEGSVKFPSLTRPLNDREIEQLRNSQDQLISSPSRSDGSAIKGLSYRPAAYPQQRQRQQHKQNRQHHPLPQTYSDALRPSSEAIVITESTMPFKICDVNGPWEDLCGYSFAESKGKSLGTLLSGKETDRCSVTTLIHQLFVNGEEATTVLTNYTKKGAKFRNRLRVGPIYDEDTGNVSHFVGVLKKVSLTA
mmetsp:Transcript_25696/g.28787  ORF Transcript_25696/g.28787 Transcript_25696/m.28787 type:complete len:365 (-) Transcript_25696:29-1123(-)